MTTTTTESPTADAETDLAPDEEIESVIEAEIELAIGQQLVPAFRRSQFQEAVKSHLSMLDQLRTRILHATPEQLEWLRETALEISGHHLAHVEAARTSRLQADALLAVCGKDDEATEAESS